jgi:hypothetical protein
MDEKKNWAIEKAIELTRSALESPTGNNDDMLRPGQAAEFLDAMYEKIVELQGR